MEPVLKAVPPGPIGVAVSGGGDSMALLALLADWAAREGRSVKAITIDHALRPDSAAEAEAVARAAAALGVPHVVQRWQGWLGTGNLQDAARRARTALMADWAAREGLAAVALGHTLDDQAETVVMRLARGSGVDGLAAMAPVVRRGGALWVRPLLRARRAALREHLRGRGIAWIEDPSNEDMRFDRVRVRAAMPELAELGLTPERLAATAGAMSRARRALEAEMLRLAREIATVQPIGTVTFHHTGYGAAEEETRLRLLAHALRWVAAARYRPRLDALCELDAGLCAGGETGFPRTLHGCLIERRGDSLRIGREPGRTGPPVPAGALWDRRWRTAAEVAGLTVSALGEAGVRALEYAPPHPRAALMASPAFWRDGALFAAPFAKPRKDCHVELVGGTEGFFHSDGRIETSVVSPM